MLKTCSGHVSLHMLYSNNWVFTSKVGWGKGVCIIHVETQGNCQALEIREFSIFYTEFPLVAYDNFLIRHWVSFRTFSCIVTPFFHYNKRPFYSYGWKWCRRWPCFDTNLPALLCKSSYSYQRAKRVMSDSPALVDFAIGHVNFVLNLPYWQALFLGKIQTTEGL